MGRIWGKTRNNIKIVPSAHGEDGHPWPVEAHILPTRVPDFLMHAMVPLDVIAPYDIEFSMHLKGIRKRESRSPVPGVNSDPRMWNHLDTDFSHVSHFDSLALDLVE